MALNWYTILCVSSWYYSDWQNDVFPNWIKTTNIIQQPKIVCQNDRSCIDRYCEEMVSLEENIILFLILPHHVVDMIGARGALSSFAMFQYAITKRRHVKRGKSWTKGRRTEERQNEGICVDELLHLIVLCHQLAAPILMIYSAIVW